MAILRQSISHLKSLNATFPVVSFGGRTQSEAEWRRATANAVSFPACRFYSQGDLAEKQKVDVSPRWLFPGNGQVVDLAWPYVPVLNTASQKPKHRQYALSTVHRSAVRSRSEDKSLMLSVSEMQQGMAQGTDS